MPIAETLRSRPRILNRLRPILIHIPRYTIQGQHRLAVECGVSSSTISRLVHNQINPSYYLAHVVTDAISKRMGKPLDMRDLFSTDNTFPTACVCDLFGCKGCFPPYAYDEEGNLLVEYSDLLPSDWCRYRPLVTPPASTPNTSSLTSPV